MCGAVSQTQPCGSRTLMEWGILTTPNILCADRVTTGKTRLLYETRAYDVEFSIRRKT